MGDVKEEDGEGRDSFCMKINSHNIDTTVMVSYVRMNPTSKAIGLGSIYGLGDSVFSFSLTHEWEHATDMCILSPQNSLRLRQGL